jgi:hypothetical protein
MFCLKNWEKKTRRKKKEFEKAFKALREIYTSEEGINQVVLQDLQLFHFPLGYEVDVTGPIEFDDELPNIFSGEPIKGKSKIYFDKVDYDNKFCVMKYDTKPDSDDLKKVLAEFYRKMGLKDKDFKKLVKSAVLEVGLKRTFEYYYIPGVPHKIEFQKTVDVNVGGVRAKRYDKTVIERIYPD